MSQATQQSAPAAATSDKPGAPQTVLARIQNRSHIYSVQTATVNCIRKGDYEGTMAALNKDLLRLNDHYPSGWYGGNNNLLHVAVYFNQLKIITKLLDMGSFLECRTAFDYTPLMIACTLGFKDVMFLLLERGADLTLVDKNNRSCRDLAHTSIRDAITEYLRPKTPPPPEVIPEPEVIIFTEEERKLDERRRIKIKFDEADADGSGELDATELAAFCETLGTKLTPEELEAALLILDESGDGNISYEEFAEWWLDD